ncbi:uncharacterized protein B0I36DRAFT_55499 [Microdochium trichocladiopsis]|uniref:Secreted protein n=1 Tax=Microdochium trichocladiopsis TaxID=1682393 RepID=A0A9P8XQ40_9PEZI|nr:uncharacterized protein B0I36DRAFT_55499 [Microdochium trichocladiopsis]KAH7010762.1 hypothetical protein B0I36DRAFT_55499 [Microdochium trichocladiopsis]
MKLPWLSILGIVTQEVLSFGLQALRELTVGRQYLEKSTPESGPKFVGTSRGMRHICYVHRPLVRHMSYTRMRGTSRGALSSRTN